MWSAPCAAQDHPGGMLGVETPWWPEIRRECPQALKNRGLDGHAYTHQERIEHLETCAIDILSDDPIHPVLESIAPRSGTAVGLSSGWDLSHGADQTALAARFLVSINRFWLATAQYTVAPRLGHSSVRHLFDRARFDTYVTYWDLPRLANYGLGPTSPHVDVPFNLRDFVAGADLTVPTTAWLHLGARAEFRHPQTDSSPRSFARYGMLAQFTSQSIPPYSSAATLEYSVFEDLSGGAASFGRLTAALHWTHPLAHTARADSSATVSLLDHVFCHEAKVRSCDYGAITVRGSLTIANTFAHSAVPFYYQPTLGGTDLEGFDTLRGFDDYRFRAPNDWLGQAEYSRRVWGPIGLLVFYDLGKVSLHPSTLNLANVRQDFGLGATFTVLTRVVMRAYVAFGGGEGTATAVKLAQF